MRDTILIVEDNQTDKLVIKGLVSQAGLSTVIANNGLEAAEKALSCADELSAIFLDLNMPEVTGVQFLLGVSGSLCLKKVPIYIITGKAKNQFGYLFEGFGVKEVIQKPILNPTSHKMIRDILQHLRPSQGVAA